MWVAILIIIIILYPLAVRAERAARDGAETESERQEFSLLCDLHALDTKSSHQKVDEERTEAQIQAVRALSAKIKAIKGASLD